MLVDNLDLLVSIGIPLRFFYRRYRMLRLTLRLFEVVLPVPYSDRFFFGCYVFRSTMGVGTLVPFMKIVCQKGDIFDIKLTQMY